MDEDPHGCEHRWFTVALGYLTRESECGRCGTRHRSEGYVLDVEMVRWPPLPT